LFIPGLKPPVTDLIDIALVAVLVYALIVWGRGARAHLALAGIGILGCVYLLARQLGLGLTAWIFQAFFAVFLIGLIVIFQDELRQVFERLAVWGLRSSRRRAAAGDPATTLARAVSKLVSARRGALIILPGRDPLERHIEGGIKLEGRLSEPLLLSLFDPNSPGHDGAAVLDGDQVRLFAAHLPLSADHEQLAMRGTRHAAALGLAERTDALCVVVSEETGGVSLAKGGRLTELRQATELTAKVREHLEEEAGPEPAPSEPFRLLRKNWREAAIAVGVSVVLWALVIPGSKESERTVRVPVVIENLPVGYALENVDPAEVEATVSGLRRDLFFLDSLRMEAAIDSFLVQLGRRTFEVAPESVRHSGRVTVTAVEPRRVSVLVKRTAADEGKREKDATVQEKAQ
jgi:uncharacterized protein (TIGR00159 family)